MMLPFWSDEYTRLLGLSEKTGESLVKSQHLTVSSFPEQDRVDKAPVVLSQFLYTTPPPPLLRPSPTPLLPLVTLPFLCAPTHPQEARQERRRRMGSCVFLQEGKKNEAQHSSNTAKCLHFYLKYAIPVLHSTIIKLQHVLKCVVSLAAYLSNN